MHIDTLSNILFSLVSPPAANLMLVILSVALFQRRRVIASTLLSLSFTSLYLLSLPSISNYLAESTETVQAINTDTLKQLQKSSANRAIVVLAGGRHVRSPEYGEIDTLNAQSIERLTYAAWLHKKINSPILLSGGSPDNEATSQAVLMNQLMMSSFDIAPKWIESNSRNTIEQVQFSSMLLEKARVEEVVLVTHAQEMPIAVAILKESKLSIVPAPLGFSNAQRQPFSLIPDADSLNQSTVALRARLNLLWVNHIKLD